MPPLNAIDWAIERTRLDGEAAAATRLRNKRERERREEKETALLLLLAADQGTCELEEAMGTTPTEPS
jgi:hypothetical protein